MVPFLGEIQDFFEPIAAIAFMGLVYLPTFGYRPMDAAGFLVRIHKTL